MTFIHEGVTQDSLFFFSFLFLTIFSPFFLFPPFFFFYRYRTPFTFIPWYITVLNININTGTTNTVKNIHTETVTVCSMQ